MKPLKENLKDEDVITLYASRGFAEEAENIFD
jgi:hypothetical protein